MLFEMMYPVITTVLLLVVLSIVSLCCTLTRFNNDLREAILSHGRGVINNNIDIPTYYINLDESVERRNNILKQFSEYSPNTILTRIPAISTNHRQHKLTTGEVGCYLSHMKAIKTAYDNDDQWALILEDDVELILTPYWEHTLSELITEAPDNCGIIQLYYYNRVPDDSSLFSLRRHKDYSSAAYIISRKAMKYNMDNFDDNFSEPIDIDLFRSSDYSNYITNRYYLNVDESGNSSIIGRRCNSFKLLFKTSDKARVYNRNMGKYVFNVDLRGHIDPLFEYILKKAIDKPLVYNCEDIPSDITLADVLRNCTYNHKLPHITISGESQRCTNDEAIAHIVSSKPITSKDIYIPYGIRTIRQDTLDSITSKRFKKIADRRYGVAYINSNCTQEREEIFSRLYDKIPNSHSLGRCRGGTPTNIKGTDGDDWGNNYKHLQDYRFIIAMENKKYPGYLTEKIVNAFASGAIPIYMGDRDTVETYFNKEAFINVSDFSTVESCVDYISKLTDEDLQKLQDLQVIKNYEVFEYDYYDSVAEDLRNRLLEAKVKI